MTSKHVPLRTCIGTSQKLPQGQLLRFVNVSGTPTLDISQTLPGRGTYILPTQAAFESALKRRAFAAKLKTTKPPLPWPEIAQMLDTAGFQGHKAPQHI